MHRIYLGGDNDRLGDRFPREAVSKILCDYGLRGFTLIPAFGYWNGAKEEIWIIEIEKNPENGIEALARHLRTFFNQETIGLVTVGEFTLVSR
jgi:hypothetical protein